MCKNTFKYPSSGFSRINFINVIKDTLYIHLAWRIVGYFLNNTTGHIQTEQHLTFDVVEILFVPNYFKLTSSIINFKIHQKGILYLL